MSIPALAAAVPGPIYAAIGVVIASATAWPAIGATGGVLGGIAGLAGTYLALRSASRQARREYETEISAAETRGAASVRAACDAELRSMKASHEASIQALRDRYEGQMENLTQRNTQLANDISFWRGRAFPDNPQGKGGTP